MRVSEKILLAFRLLKGNLEEFKQDFNRFASKTEDRFDRLYGLVDGLAGDFKKFDEEQVILSASQSENSDRLVKLEKKVFG